MDGLERLDMLAESGSEDVSVSGVGISSALDWESLLDKIRNPSSAALED